jgi:hypothetical protein
MCQFYGFQQCDEVEIAEIIDMYSEREYATTFWNKESRVGLGFIQLGKPAQNAFPE